MKVKIISLVICILFWVVSPVVAENVIAKKNKPSEQTATIENFEPYFLETTFSFPIGTLKFDFLPDGKILILVKENHQHKIYAEKTSGSRDFQLNGILDGVEIPGYGPAFLRVSPDGKHFALGTNNPNNGKIWVFNTDSLTGRWFVLNNHADAEWYDDSMLAVTSGPMGQPTSVVVINTNSSGSSFNQTTVVENIGGGSAGITFDDVGNLYTGNGYKYSGPSETGVIKSFTRAKWMAVLQGDAPIDFEKDGFVIVDILSAASLGFDAMGNLYVGGGEYLTGGGGDTNYSALIKGSAVQKAAQGAGAIDPNDSANVCRIDPDENNVNFYMIN